MKTLTICQPWAELIVSGQKLVENRKWATRYRGPLLIHAGKSTAWLDTYDPRPKDMAFGAIVGQAQLVACLSLPVLRRAKSAGPFAWVLKHKFTEGPYCWILGDVERLERPIPYSGQQGLFEVPEEELAMHPAVWIPAGPPARRCRVCGCTEHAACEDGCWWVEEDLCSTCVEVQG